MPHPNPALRAPVTPGPTKLHPLAISDVHLSAGFWAERQELNSTAIIPHCEEWMTRLGWVGNFERAADCTIGSGHRGREFADSEIYKLIEAMAWQSGRSASADVESHIERLVTIVAAAQDDDGYVHTLFGREGQAPRYSDVVWGHELYCFGHLIQAAVARARTSEDRRLLDVARRLADHICIEFGPRGRDRVCGHAAIEVALVELYRVTGDGRYLDQAALYLAAGAVDVAVETRDDDLVAALIAQWDATVARRTYITGGMGSHHMDEAFGEDFVLPPDRSYCETCAGVASIMFSWRLLLATGEPRFADLIERTLYNIVATSPARDGRAFFYANTLHQRSVGTPAAMNDDGVAIRGGSSGRETWFEVSCCPPNVARTFASLTGYLATATSSGIQLHQYAAMTAHVTLPGGTREIELAIDTQYPSHGRIAVQVVQSDGAPWTLTLRVPAWAGSAILEVGGEQRAVTAGTVEVRRAFAPGEVVVLELPMNPRWSYPDDRIDAVRGCVAVERGPEVFCLESVDLPVGVQIDAVRIDVCTALREALGRVFVRLRSVAPVDGTWPFVSTAAPTRTAEPTFDCALVPYSDWAERGPSTMRVSLPT